MNKNLKIFFAKHSFDKKTNEDLWAKVKNKDSSFQEQENPLFHAAPENPKLPSVKILSQTKESYLPLEYMKKEETHFLSQEALKNSPKIFLSSGTTQSNRSLSYFSKDGLTLYKLGSIKTFYDLLSHFFRTDELATIEGISLIPKTDEWPDSSLAQMIQWFSEFWPVTYLKDEKKLPKPPNKALWFFATAIQLMHWYKQGIKYALPPGSLIIETGGTKGQKEQFSRKDLYEAIENIFSVPQKNIISEYGMCELACQAYDFSTEETKLEERSYSFPTWTEIFVLRPLGEVKREGFGSLLIKDPLRIDYPYAMRTQDMASIKAKGKSFTLKGRVPSAILKGCSLKAEELLSPTRTELLETDSGELQKPITEQLESLNEEKLRKVHSFLLNFFTQKKIEALLKEELNSDELVKSAINDLLDDFSLNLEKWQEIIVKSQAKPGDHWFLILPNNHSFVIFYPVIVAFLSQIKLSIRLPRAFNKNSIVTEFIKKIEQEFKYFIEKLPPHFRFSEQSQFSKKQAILAYGSDETLAFFAKKITCPMNFFGSGISLSVFEKLEHETLVKVLKDAFSLGQKGCFSSRLVFCLDQDIKDPQKFTQNLNLISKKYLGLSLSQEQALALDHESLKFINKEGFFVSHLNEDSPIFPLLIKSKKTPLDLEQLLSSCQYVLPFVFCSTGEFLNLLEQNERIKKISMEDQLNAKLWMKSELKEKEICSLGELNKTLWDGTHQNKKLFRKSKN